MKNTKKNQKDIHLIFLMVLGYEIIWILLSILQLVTRTNNL